MSFLNVEMHLKAKCRLNSYKTCAVDEYNEKVIWNAQGDRPLIFFLDCNRLRQNDIKPF